MLGITDVDPLQYGLLFERFLNPDRVSPPDIDVDFCEARRGEVLEYVRQKYGERRVSQIITFGKLKAKSVVRDVGRVIGLSYGEADRIAKMIPNELNITLAAAAEKMPELKRAIETEPATSSCGTTRSRSKDFRAMPVSTRRASSSGTAISPSMCRSAATRRAATSSANLRWARSMILGLLKMDFLGLKTLTVIEDTVTLIRRREPDFSLKNIRLDDAASFALYNRGETLGLFQMESGGMTSVSKQFDVQKIDDIIALIALYRPGPMDLIPEYIKAKKGTDADTIFASVTGRGLRRHLRHHDLSGTGDGGGEQTRRLLVRPSRFAPARHGEKDREKMAKERVNFIEGCARTNQIGEKKANAIFDLLEKFAGYGFNKSHSAAYGLISYQTAYLKANYPVEFMCRIVQQRNQ